MSEIFRLFLEAGLVDPEVLGQMRSWGMDIPKVSMRPIRTREDLERFLERVDYVTEREIEEVPQEIWLDRRDALERRVIGPPLLEE